MLLREINDQFCDLLNGWHELEKNLPDGETIVDFNLPDWESRQHFQNRKEVLSALENLLANDGARTDRMFFHRLVGLRAYLLDVLNERTTPIDDYLPATMGFKILYIPDHEIECIKKAAIDSLLAVGIDFNDALKGLETCSASIPVDEIPAWFRQQFNAASQDALRIFPDAPKLIEPDVSIFEDSSMTRARISGSGNKFSVAFNRRIMKEENEETLRNTFRHEILGHAVQASLWADKISSGHWPNYRGMTCMQTVEVFQMETLAEYAPTFYGEATPLRKAISDLHMFNRQVANNLYYMILKEGVAPDAASKYYLSHTPYRDENFAAARIRHLQSNSLSRCYSPVYGPAHRLTRHIMDSLKGTTKIEFMRKLYEGYMDPTDIQALGISMGVAPMRYFEPVRPPEIATLG